MRKGRALEILPVVAQIFFDDIYPRWVVEKKLVIFQCKTILPWPTHAIVKAHYVSLNLIPEDG